MAARLERDGCEKVKGGEGWGSGVGAGGMRSQDFPIQYNLLE